MFLSTNIKMFCTLCGKNKASVFYMEISGKGRIVSGCFCSECAKTRPETKKLIDAYLNRQKKFRNKKKKCPICGMTQDDWKQSGFAGCAFCYQVFRNEIISDMKNYHNVFLHRGKSPLSRMRSSDKSERLKAKKRKTISVRPWQVKKIKNGICDEFIDKKQTSQETV